MNRFALFLITLVALVLSACQTTSNNQLSAQLMEKIERGTSGFPSLEERESCTVPSSISEASFPLSESLVTEEPIGKTISKGLKLLSINQDNVSNKKELKNALEKSILESKSAILFLVELNGQQRFLSEKTGCVVLAFATLLGAEIQTITTSRNDNKNETLEHDD